jgi:hypothetical protein
MFDIAVSYSVPDFCLDVLKKRFPGDPLRQKINEYDDDKLNFACPYCGDSEKDPNKKRGHMYLTTQTYKCYNDGCAIWVKLDKFVSKFAQKYQLNIPGVEEKKVEFKPSVSTKKKGFLIEFLINREVGKKLLVFSDLVDRFTLFPCSSANPNSPIGQFIDRRKINNLPVFEQSCYYDSRQDKIYIFNLDLKSGRVLGFAVRRISDDYPGPKYNIKNYSDFKKTGILTDLEDEFIREVDSINNYFNILNIDFSKKITITEGQIDAMFVDNCIATTGVTKSKQLLDNLVAKNNVRILFDNDSAGKNQTIDLIKKGYTVFLWNKLTTSLRRKYPKAVREITEIKDINDLYRFMLTKETDLTFEKFNELLNKYFSDSVFDLLLV